MSEARQIPREEGPAGYISTTDHEDSPFTIYFLYGTSETWQYEVEVLRGFVTAWANGERSEKGLTTLSNVPRITRVLVTRGMHHSTMREAKGDTEADHITAFVCTDEMWRNKMFVQTFHIYCLNNNISTGQYRGWKIHQLRERELKGKLAQRVQSACRHDLLASVSGSQAGHPAGPSNYATMTAGGGGGESSIAGGQLSGSSVSDQTGSIGSSMEIAAEAGGGTSTEVDQAVAPQALGYKKDGKTVFFYSHTLQGYCTINSEGMEKLFEFRHNANDPVGYYFDATPFYCSSKGALYHMESDGRKHKVHFQ